MMTTQMTLNNSLCAINTVQNNCTVASIYSVVEYKQNMTLKEMNFVALTVYIIKLKIK